MTTAQDQDGQPANSSVDKKIYTASRILAVVLVVLNPAALLLSIRMLQWAQDAMAQSGERWGLLGVVLYGLPALILEAMVLLPATLLAISPARRRLADLWRWGLLPVIAAAICVDVWALSYVGRDAEQHRQAYESGNVLYTSGLRAAIVAGDAAKARSIAAGDSRALSEHDYEGDTPLIMAVKRKDIAMVKTLLEVGANPNATGWSGLPGPLHAAAQSRNVEIARLLLDHGADINQGDHDSRTPLAYAEEARDKAMIALLQSRGGAAEDLKKRMFEAMHFGRVEEVKALIDKDGFDPKYRYPNGTTLISQAAEKDNRELVEYLIGKGADIKATYPGGTALHDAASRGHTSMCLFLIDNGVPLDVKNHLGATAVKVARQRGYSETVRALIDRGVPE